MNKTRPQPQSSKVTMFNTSIPTITRMAKDIRLALELKAYIRTQLMFADPIYDYPSEAYFYCGVIISDYVNQFDQGYNKCLMRFIPSTHEELDVLKDESKTPRFNNKIDRLAKYTKRCVVIRRDQWNSLQTSALKAQFLVDHLPFYLNSTDDAITYFQSFIKNYRYMQQPFDTDYVTAPIASSHVGFNTYKNIIDDFDGLLYLSPTVRVLH